MHALEMDCRAGEHIASHCHTEDQLLYAADGVIRVSTERGDWVVPAGHALWVPSGVSHALHLHGAVCLRTLLLARQAERCQLLVVSGLLRELILAASSMLGLHEGEHARALIRHELGTARRIDGFVAMPRHRRLQAWCERFLDDPSQDLSLQACGEQLNMSARNVARLFQRELGMSYGEWRARARVMLSQPHLAAGRPVLAVALEHGYQSASAFTAMFKRILGHAPSQWLLGLASHSPSEPC
ncbi:helix-turn-helix transcriptional regulator [Pseudomonas sp. S75]|uniref:AraC family transcriptional regulator n=1 Tax=unclassified Pseudomonas TaxID=196821 RepID=UPI0019057029|nr:MULTISPECIES: helix-turn-helix transcriptional regulator [unclassified Pseudomonas]MBJ9976448.1 helix-turn-helix transcriptional regulator [Pseudomonas sp. S30]MBK0155652.1 helix-turn-helix transcriptional regulator [Pseudomonas sp. S75]